MIRIVKMTFAPDQVGAFLAVFEASKEKIRAFEGCERLELLQVKDQPNVLMTYSWWRGEEALESYRHSELFATTWQKTKVLFAGRPEAWSMERLEMMD